MKRIFYLFLLFVSCTSNYENYNNFIIEDNDLIEWDGKIIEGRDFIILDYSHYPIFERKAELTHNDFDIINKILYEAICRYNEIYKQPFEKEMIYENYKRQYICYFNEAGEKEVFINCFHKSFIRNNDIWESELIRVFDGGNYFFKITINITNRTYYDFLINF